MEFLILDFDLRFGLQSAGGVLNQKSQIKNLK